MAGRPRQNRASIKGTHLSIRLTDKEVATLDALVVKANKEREAQHVEALKRWEARQERVSLKLTRPTPPKPATFADVVRDLLQHDARTPRLYEKGFWAELKGDTEPLDHLVDLANDREPAAYRWNRETMLRKLIEEEWSRRRLRKLERRRYRNAGTMRALREEQWRQQANEAAASDTVPLVVCPQCGSSFQLPPR